MKNIFKRIKEEKDFRFDFIICIWSAIIIIAIILVIIFGVMYAVRKGGNLHDSITMSESTAQPSVSPSATPSTAPSAIPSIQPDDEEGLDDDIDDGLDEDSNPDKSENNITDNSNNNDSTETKVYATTNVNIRSEASTTASSLGRLFSGQQVVRTEQLANGWSKIKYNGKEAYVKSEFLTTNSFTATKAPVTKKPNSNKIPTATPKASNNKKLAKVTKAPAKDVYSDTSDNVQNKTIPVTEAPTKVPDNSDIPIAATSEPAMSSAATNTPATTTNSAAPNSTNQ